MKKSKYTLEFSLSDGRLGLFNTLHGSIDLLSAPARQRWTAIAAALPADSDAIYYHSRGHLVASEAEEDASVCNAFKSFTNSLDAAPSCYVFFPTFQCNLRCKYCFQHSSLKKHDSVMSPSMIAAAFALVDREQSRRTNAPHPMIGILGGEPLLSPYSNGNAVEIILSETQARGWNAELVSNGTNLAQYATHLAKYVKTLRSLQVSMDGPQDWNDRRKRYVDSCGSPFASTIAGIASALTAGLNVSIRLNVDGENIDSVPEFLHWLSIQECFSVRKPSVYVGVVKTYGRRYRHSLEPTIVYRKLFSWINSGMISNDISLGGCTPLNNLSLSFYSAVPSSPTFSYCAANRDMLCFGPDGSIYPCVVAAGDITASAGTYWPQEAIKRDALSAWRNHNIYTQAKCETCSAALVCGGGCAYEALKHHGSMKEPFCEPIIELLHIGLDQFSRTCPMSDAPIA